MNDPNNKEKGTGKETGQCSHQSVSWRAPYITR